MIIPLPLSYIQTPVPPTPSPPPSRPVSSKSVRSAVSTASAHPTQEIQRLLRELGELSGRHNLLDDRVSGLEVSYYVGGRVFVVIVVVILN